MSDQDPLDAPDAADEASRAPGDQLYDTLVVGGGPAGLTAAIYLTRFHRKVIVVDKGEGRLRMIPRSHNHAGYPNGVAGADLLDSMRNQATRYGAELRHGEVTAIRRQGDGFIADTDQGPVRSRTVLLATGVVNHRPPLPEDVHAEAVGRGQLRYCPICDAFEQTGKRIGVLGGDRHGLAEALFLRTYSPDIILFSLTGTRLSPDERAEAEIASIAVVDAPVSAFDFGKETVVLTLADGSSVPVDTLYVALGSHTRKDLGAMLGTRLVEDECFATDPDQRTSAPGVYAAGDAVDGLDQIGMAMGTGSRAAVSIHNDLRDKDGATLSA